MKNLTEIVREESFNHVRSYLTLGYLRYEVLRQLNPRQFKELWERGLNSERFDDMIDELVVKKANE